MDIFISYAREDRSQAERLARALEAEGFDVWWDRDSLRSGQSFNRAIQQALAQAKCVVVLWSQASVTSKWVESEAYWAWDNNKLHSVRLDDTVPLPVPFNTIHARSLASWVGGADFPELRRLLADITALIGPRDRIREAPPGAKAAQIMPPAEPATPPTASVGQPQQPESSVKPESNAAAAPVRPRRLWSPMAVGLSVLAALIALIPFAVYLSTWRSEAQRQPIETFRDCPDCPEMLVIPPGSYQMGSAEGEFEDEEHPRHEVRIGKAFAIGKTEVTFEQWDACVAAKGCRHTPEDAAWGRGTRPVINVSWDDAREYIAWLAQKTGMPYRLPTEAEWEYAARAGSDTDWSFGGSEGDLDRYAWYRANAGDTTHPVGEKAPNTWGLFDMHGNVWEWMQDCLHDNYQGAPGDGSTWEGGDCRRRVVRGGSWPDLPYGLRSAARKSSEPSDRATYLGFRLAQDR